MKAWMTVVSLAVVPLAVGCTSSRELTRARVEASSAKKDADTLREENATLKERVGELETQLAKVLEERDTLKAEAEKPPEPVVAPAAGKKRPGKK
ncbi:hypothetical protein A176_007067 [Myxococcus hansupus]|uniref:Lipoprotein n=1 Tax=Pseudomyxococcus hansupus TaxID=1297742 RepID=A0A0H4X9A1_9BACT|nr:hypothetical protein [Myxococcus hansupus]AKQ70155.1 hypothetical protein A176_007067 [Myxococcus hansupus]